MQLVELKLLALGEFLLTVTSAVGMRFFHGYLRIPTSAEALTMSVQRFPLAWHLRWESQILAFFENVLRVSGLWATFTFPVAEWRVSMPCETPIAHSLRSPSLNFFNRYYYYFKELLVDFFFYLSLPQVLERPSTDSIDLCNLCRSFLFGNAFFHFIRDWNIIRDDGLLNAMSNYQTYFFIASFL